MTDEPAGDVAREPVPHRAEPSGGGKPTVLFLHPGAMGARLAGECRGAGRRLWVTDGRSGDTVKRADVEGLESVTTLATGLSQADIVISVCPPDAALAQAETVAAIGPTAGFDGVYVDANAVAPATSGAIGELFGPQGYLDGGIIGPPPGRPGSTRLYLSADPGNRVAAHEVAALWDESRLEVRVIEGGVGAASALKMSYAAWTKGSAALLLSIVAGADAFGVGAELAYEWSRSQPGLGERANAQASGVGAKAWRFSGEMIEIANTFAQVGLPDGFWRAAAETYRRLAALKEEPEPDLERVIEMLAD